MRYMASPFDMLPSATMIDINPPMPAGISSAKHISIAVGEYRKSRRDLYRYDLCGIATQIIKNNTHPTIGCVLFCIIYYSVYYPSYHP